MIWKTKEPHGVLNLDDPDDADSLIRWAKIMNKSHGYGGVFNHETSEDKAIVELSTAGEWCKSIAAEFSLAVGVPIHNPRDPPDCYVEFKERRLGVELVQLIEREHKRRASKDETPYAGKLFVDMQWSIDRFEAALNEVIQNKGLKYKKNETFIDVLVIHTAETWLASSQAEKWLTDVEILRHPHISNACLLFEYDPNSGEPHWPVFWLYGNLVASGN